MELTEAQKEIVNYDQLGTLVVKGTAGSGKSLVGLHRINYLFNKRKLSLFAEETECKVLVITFNKVMYYQLEKSFQEIRDKNIDENSVKFINIDKIIYRESAKIAEESGYKMVMRDTKTKSFINLLNHQKDKYSDEFIFDEFKWIRSNLLNNKQEYFDIVRLGRGKRKLNKEDREYIWGLLQSYRIKMREEGNIDYYDACILALKRSELTLFSEYNHIIVDEAQDLSKLKLSFIVKLNNNNQTKVENSLMFLYDSSQNVYDESWLGYGRAFSSIGLDVRRRIKKLEVSYRTTRQIHQAANNLISYYKEQNIDKETELKPTFAGTEEGIKPMVFDFNSRDEELKTVSNIIKKITKKMYKAKDIMIISFTNNSLREIKNFLNSQGIEAYILDGDKIENNSNELIEDAIKILTVNNAKGLESKVVFIANTESLSQLINNGEKDENEINIRNTKRLYTAMTRAQELLFIFKDEKYIGKINDKYITNIESYENLNIDSYLAADLEVNSVFIETNTTDRYKNLIQEYNKQTEEYEKLKEKQAKELENLKKENEKLKFQQVEEYEKQIKKFEKQIKENEKAKEKLKKEKEKLKEEKRKEIEQVKLEQVEKYEKQIQEYEKQIEENEKLKEELKKAKENNEFKLENIDKIIKDKDEFLKKEVAKDYEELAEKYVVMISEAEILHSSFERGSIGPDFVYVAYAKVLENIIRDFLDGLNQGYETKVTLGTLIGYIRKFSELRPICKTLDSLKFVPIRNEGAHRNIGDNDELKKLRKYLVEEKIILKLYRITQEKLNEKIDIYKKVEKFGELTRGVGSPKTGTIRINSKNYYPYLIDNDDLAVSKDKIQVGTYKMNGHYTISKGTKVYVIEEFNRQVTNSL